MTVPGFEDSPLSEAETLSGSARLRSLTRLAIGGVEIGAGELQDPVRAGVSTLGRMERWAARPDVHLVKEEINRVAGLPPSKHDNLLPPSDQSSSSPDL